MTTILDRKNTIASHTYNRWLIPPAALAVHLCIGQVYATSVYKLQLVERFQASDTAIGIIFSLAILMLGLSAMALGTWVERVGPRKTMFTSACFWSAGFLIGALGIATGQLWLVYLGYGVIGGIGLGIGYISPVSTLMKWFPDRPGLATGLAIMGFGGGALIATPLSRHLLSAYGYVASEVPTAANTRALTLLFVTFGIGYFVVMMLGVILIRLPAPDWTPPGWDPSKAKAKPLISTGNVSAASAIRTPQFYLLWVVLFCNVTAGIGILENAAPMIQDFFRDEPGGASAVAVAAAGGFVGVLSLFNMAGRFAWSSVSDFIGRKPTYVIFLGAGIVLYLLLAFTGNTSEAVFVLCACVIVSFYGGGFATVPAYLRDLFGFYQVGAIHGRLLTAWSAAGVVGPLIVNGFLDRAGTPGTLTASAYRPALITMVVLLAVGLVANLLIKPVAAKYQEDPEVVKAKREADLQAGREADAALSAGRGGRTSALAMLAWAVVAVGLIYGLWETVSAAIKLFS